MEFHHVSVLAGECLAALEPQRGGIYVDCTAGGGGHSSLIAAALPQGGRLICLDRDDEALAACRQRLAPFGDRVTLVKTNYSAVADVLDSLGIDGIDGVLWDLGVSSHQLDDAGRGFSYMADAPLDMRMDQCAAKTADSVVNGYDETSLRRILWDYGEEKFAPRIAAAIVRAREERPIATTTELASVIAGAIPAAASRAEAQHPATRSSQAIRIEVNGELDAIAPSLEGAIRRLKPGGRAAVITFQSLEDRIVKQTFAQLASGCTCPPDFPVCVCGKKPVIELMNRKPILPSEEELAGNPRSRSAKLRCVMKL
ncbi:MAG: 16S rRNA (cytosine(1402)-N(4))-methyltransferase RsmH [Clostridia bacterium]|nr:16S rRNA (cytosine(1402)-N(4))-methyltransferase RsmH [Clostridia bacterium]